jgi:hypothetical protein
VVLEVGVEVRLEVLGCSQAAPDDEVEQALRR